MKTFVANLNTFDYERFRDQVKAKCIISRATWHNWINGGNISQKYKPIINRVSLKMFGKAVFQIEKRKPAKRKRLVKNSKTVTHGKR